LSFSISAEIGSRSRCRGPRRTTGGRSYRSVARLREERRLRPTGPRLHLRCRNLEFGMVGSLRPNLGGASRFRDMTNCEAPSPRPSPSTTPTPAPAPAPAPTPAPRASRLTRGHIFASDLNPLWGGEARSGGGARRFAVVARPPRRRNRECCSATPVALSWLRASHPHPPRSRGQLWSSTLRRFLDGRRTSDPGSWYLARPTVEPARPSPNPRLGPAQRRGPGRQRAGPIRIAQRCALLGVSSGSMSPW
jgi:hypothetical protein